ncbi:septum site-determining protein Ssd [Ammonicoccus fulvus]|uniref:Septum site-determining protein Ssd n=1 Tax=Ammonicoccus fulvus TaxID=3138240 RepID=A0ABZ3FP55_9ACTN
MEMTPVTPAVLVTGSNEIRDHVLAAAAAAGTDIRVCADAVELSALPTPGILLVGADQVAAVARSSVVGRATVHLVGGAGDQARLCEWSAALGATVLVLPDGLRWLAAALSGAREGRGATVVAVVGASGGLGTSTLAAGLAWAAAERGLRSAFVDLDAGGGGADLIFGLERQPGWRWPGLTAADGFLGDLHEHLPHADGLAVVSHDRRDATPVPVTAAVAVVRSLGRSHDVVIIDAGARPGTTELAAIRAADGGLLVCSAEVRGLAAATRQLQQIDAHLPMAVVLSRLRQSSDGVAAVERTLGLSVAASLPADKGIAAGADRGDPPGRNAGRAWRTRCGELLDGLIGERR